MAKTSAEEKMLKILEKTQTASKPRVSKAVNKKTFNIGLKQINPLLILVVICSIGYLVYQIQQGMQLLETEVVVEPNNHFSSSDVVLSIPRAKSVEFYLSQLDQRNIFVPYEEKVAGEAVASSDGLAVRMAKYKLVGVAWLDLPESASIMLEDSESGLTHFLREGEKIEDVTVKTIYVDRVVFSYENEEIVFKL